MDKVRQRDGGERDRQRQRERERYRQTDRQKKRQTDKERQTDRQRETDRQTKRERGWGCIFHVINSKGRVKGKLNTSNYK